MHRKRVILRKTKPKSSQAEIKTFSLCSVLKSSAKFVLLFKRTFLIWFLLNFSFLYIFTLIPNGWTNSLSIVWLILYYVYWCIFIRYMQQHQPYFSLIRIFNGLIPSSKIMFMNISIYVIISIIPYIPFFMGFRDKYLEFFEEYMELIHRHNALLGTVFFYVLMLLLSPFTIGRPYLAWISALIGKSRSIMDAYKRTRGNYWSFVQCAFIMSSLIAISHYIDKVYQIKTTIYLMSFLPIYFNIVFINIYKIFYKQAKRTKQSVD